ncbi:putative ATP-dependent DNA helicase [Cotonvirus japonicus]|uniref:DNA 3'-5' helicase n=1 Tax=Cotonvirus japonicus TaxID=2811091 RepID=A0ABM7NTE0_9VIRU|nr:putative ATP-dependent DNA helicase [Cotonvirus japonicus]BCS83376.1 putative ATP-dependent DNA helicase [Cotonvirus japonicus]
MINLSNQDVEFILYLIGNVSDFVSDFTIKTYLKILGCEIDNLKLFVDEKYQIEVKKLTKILINNPKILQSIRQYIITKQSNIEFLKIFSEEQITYITDLNSIDTKLIACAGSGKTRSIIGKIRFMVEHKMVKRENIYAVTFSKHAAVDFHRRIRELFPDHEKFCCLKNFSTIDSLAKSILSRIKSHKSENVEILSIALRNFLKNATLEEIDVIRKFKNINHLFIDEAQDLNDIQHDIAVLLKKHFGTIIHLCGDPNQNIYQFRRSSNSYILEFSGKQFELTKNFRSTKEIINFSEDIKPTNTTRSVSATNKSGSKTVIITKTSSDVHKLMLTFIELYEKKKDLSNIAIICPTRGIKANNSVGLAIIFNFLKINKIPVNQLYDESGSNADRKKLVDKIPGHINLLTYHGTKGLEFDVVFVMDFYHALFNSKPTYEDHNINQYLLYVATSRAISKMFICSYTNNFGGYLNHWITRVNPDTYISDSPLKIHKLAFNEGCEYVTMGITELLENLSDEQLSTIYDYLDIDDGNGSFVNRIYEDFRDIDRHKNEALFGIFCEEFFYLSNYLAKHVTPRKFVLIENIINSKFIVVDNDIECNQLRTYINNTDLTWEKFYAIKNSIPKNIINLIEKYFNKNKQLNEYIICTSEFVYIVEANKSDIEMTYKKYLNPMDYHYDYNNILIDFYYLIVVQYAYENNHYYYINDHGKDKQQLLKSGHQLFSKINSFVKKNYQYRNINNKIIVNYNKLMLKGEIDFIETNMYGNETIVEIKCVNEINIKYYIQLLLYNFCHYNTYNNKIAKPQNLFKNGFKIINLLSGLEHYVIVSVSPENMFNILQILSVIGNLNFSDMNLVYDLETTDQITKQGPYNYKPTIPRSNIYYYGNKYYATIYPEITEIAIKDYETGMIIINTLVKPTSNINPVAEKKTGITKNMLTDKPSITTIQNILTTKMARFIKCIMMAHNGNSFDNKIVLFYKLVDPLRTSFIDTMSIIPIHMPNNTKLQNKRLEEIYAALFNKTFQAHRAMEDVDALISIMKFLGIQF